jgi:hypothetical protein
MSRTFHDGERRIRVKGIRRSKTDLRRLARVLIELEAAKMEAEAEAEYRRGGKTSGSRSGSRRKAEKSKRARGLEAGA